MAVEIYPRTRVEGIDFLNLVFPVKPSQWDPMTLDSILVPAALGKTFQVIIENELKPIRDNIAHTLLQRAEELISMDDQFSRAKVETWLPPIKCIARAMLKNDFHEMLT
jgi:hypothetical protein